MLTVYVLLIIDPTRELAVIETINMLIGYLPEVKHITHVMGPYDAIVKLEAPDILSAQAFIDQHILTIRGVEEGTKPLIEEKLPEAELIVT